MVVCRFSQGLDLGIVEMTHSGYSDLPFMRFARCSQLCNLPEEWTTNQLSSSHVPSRDPLFSPNRFLTRCLFRWSFTLSSIFHLCIVSRTRIPPRRGLTRAVHGMISPAIVLPKRGVEL